MNSVLPSNLLVARVRRGRVEPLLLEPEGLPLALASEVLERFAESVGRSRKEIEERMHEVEELALEVGLDIRVVRGMATLAAREAVFEPVKLRVDPLRARLELFEEVGRSMGAAVTVEERRKALEKVAARLGCSVDDLEAALSRYLDEELVEPPRLSPEELVKKLNLSMVQTLLFKALRMEVKLWASGLAVKRLLRTAKRLGLLYMAERLSRGGVLLEIDGPASLLRQVRRYGTRLAKLVPYVMASGRWEIRATILTGRGRRLLFSLGSGRAYLFPREEPEVEPVFDSEVEREFYKSLTRIAPGWRVEREPEPLVAGNRIFVPDFAVCSSEGKVYIEVVGFWTHDYLKRKLEKLRELQGVKLIVAVDEELACSSFSELPHDVVVFRRRLRGVDVYPLLKRYLGGGARSSRAGLRVDLEALRERLPDLNGLTLGEAAELLKGVGVGFDAVVEVLERLGYRVDWSRSLDPKRARVRRA